MNSKLAASAIGLRFVCNWRQAVDKLARTSAMPIHEHLIEIGFLDLVKATGRGVFYNPKDKRAQSKDPVKPVRPPYVIARQKLAEWVRNDVSVTDPDVSHNHAWRQTFKRQAAPAGMERRFRFAFCGHETDEIGDIYETPTLEDMAEVKEVPKVPAGIGEVSLAAGISYARAWAAPVRLENA